MVRDAGLSRGAIAVVEGQSSELTVDVPNPAAAS
jgi:hypothetical protein